MYDRVVLIHDTPDQTIISEMDIEQASVLLERLQEAVATVLAGLHERAACSYGMQALVV